MAIGNHARGVRPYRTGQVNRSNAVSTRLSLAAAAALAASSLLVPGDARATSDAWDGQTNGLWATSTNWATDPAIVPGTGDTATFNGPGNGNTSIDLGAGVTINNIVFDAGAAAYTIGNASGQSLSLDAGGSIIMNAGVTNGQTIGVAGTTLNLSAAANAGASLTNNSTSLLTIGANVVANNASGNGVLNFDGTGNIAVTGTITEPGAGANALFKRGSGTTTLSNGSAWSGAGAVQTAFSGPFTVQEGVLRLNGGTHAVNGEAVIGGVVTHGGAGQNATVQVDAGALNVNNWFSVGRGNGTGGVTSSLVLNNNATTSVLNLSGGFNAGNAANLPRAAITLNDTSNFTVTNNNANYNWGESAGSYATMTLNGSSTMVHNGNASGTRIGMAGTGILNVASPTATANVRNLIIGQGGNGVGAVYNRGTLLSINLDGLFLGDGATSSSYFLNDNGTAPVANAVAGNIVAGIGANSNAVVDVTSGTIGGTRVGTGFFNNNANNGQFNVSGGTLSAGGTGFQVADTTGRTGAKWGNINVTGTGTFNSTGPINLSLPNLATNTGLVSVTTGGTLVADTITAGGANPLAVVNFDGGTLRAQGTTPSLVSGNVDRISVFAGGMTVDTNGANKTIDAPILAPVGDGITGISLSGTGTDYEGRPIVKISDPTGTGATAVANFDVATGQVTGVTITSPGVGYTAPSVTVSGGGGTALNATATFGASAPGGGFTKTGAGSATLTAANTYPGATLVTGGNLVVGGSGNINSSSGITVNGTGARFTNASSVSVTPAVTVTNGTVAGSGTINTVTVADSVNNHIANGNNDTGVLTIDSLTLNGAAAFDLSPANQSPVVVTNTLTTGAVNAAPDIVAVNASRPLGTWLSGTYNLISYNTLGGAGFSAFEQGTIGGLTSRQSAVLSNPAGFISLTISGDNPIWTGSLDGTWTTAIQANPKNWTTTTGGTDFIAADTVIFNDSGVDTSVEISTANVSPSVMFFENTTAKPYTVSSPGGFGITGIGSLTKNNTGSVTISTNNAYTGGTTVNNGTLTLSGANNFGNTAGFTVNGGTLNLSGGNSGTGPSALNGGTLNVANANALGNGTLTLAGGTLDNTSGGALALAGNNPQNWANNWTFGGSNSLNLGTGAVTITTPSIQPQVSITTNGASTLTVGGNIAGVDRGVTKLGTGTLVFSGNNTYNGTTTIKAGEWQVTGGTTGVLTSNIELAPATTDVATMSVSGGTINVNRLIVAGAGANDTSPGTAVLNQSAGTINSQQWFTVGSGGNIGTPAPTGGTGTYNFSGGTHNVIGQQMEVANFAAATGTVNMSGTAALGIRNSNFISMGANNNSGDGLFNQNGGTVTFYSDAAGATVGGNGILYLGRAGTLTSTHTYNLNAGTLTVPQVQRNTANQATANFNFNGGTLRAARANATMMFGLTRANVRNGGAIIDSNGFDVTVAQPLVHSNIGGDAATDGGLTKNGAGALTISGAATYTGNTVVNAGTLRLPTFVAPNLVGNYTFDELADGGQNAATVVTNTGSGGAAMNGAVNHTDNPFADPNSAFVGAGRFGKGLTLDGLGSSVDVANRIVDQAGAGSWTFSTWLKTSQLGSAIMVKNAGGNTWQAGHSEFYLASTPIGPNGGNLNLPTAVRNAGGFVQGNQPVADDAWHMLTFVADANTRFVYVDGVQVALNLADFTTADTATITRFGYHGNTVPGDGGVNLFGSLDEMKFYTGVLTAAQILELYNTNAFTPVTGRQYLPTATAVSLTATGAALDLADNSQTIGSLAGVAGTTVTLGTGVLTTGGTNAPTTFAGSISGTGGLNKVGTGTFTVSGASTYTGGTTVAGGTLVAGHANAIGTGGSLTVNGGATMRSQAGVLTALDVGTLSVAPTGRLDLNDGGLVKRNGGSGTAGQTATQQITALLKQGLENGGNFDWLGNGISSTEAAADNATAGSVLYGLGVIQNNLNAAGAPDGTTTDATGGNEIYATFKGRTVGLNDTLVRYTYMGDADLDGAITGTDYSLIDAGFGAALAGWLNGDFDYSGSIDGTDYALIDNAFGAQVGVLPEEYQAIVAEHTALFGQSYVDALAWVQSGGGVVPEPASIGVLGLAGVGLLARRRRSRR